MKTYPRVLTIAGSDSCGGAGIQADIKAISATGSYAASAITAVTVQNTLGVEAVHSIPTDILRGQIEAVLSDIGADAVKIGMLHSGELIRTVFEELDKFRLRNIVLDPVMVSTSGHRLIEEEAINVLRSVLIPRARVITPNVFMKAGHLDDPQLVDIFYNAEKDHCIELVSERVDTPNTHGTGCTLSSALASYLAQGLSLDDAARAAKDYISKAIESGAEYKIGNGHGPVNHFWTLK